MMTDDEFDRELAFTMRMHARAHFTPIDIARRAARFLAPGRVLDIGSGVGKFCIAAARECPAATFVGIELRERLVAEAWRIAGELANVSFIAGDAFDLDWSTFDALYLFNPFGEHLLQGAVSIDRAIDLDPAHHARFVHETARRLAAMPAGTRLATYHGIGIDPPASYERVEDGLLQLYVMRRA